MISHIVKLSNLKETTQKELRSKSLTCFWSSIKHINQKEFTLLVNTSPFQQYTQTGDVLRGGLFQRFTHSIMGSLARS